MKVNYKSLNEPKHIFVLVSRKRYMLACSPIEDSDHAVHPSSLMKVSDMCSMDSQGSKLLEM